jgi:Pyruvate/2-oxoacid:ferredoxin oxidoreductase delta subunit
MAISPPHEPTRLIVFCQPEEPDPQREACLGVLIERCDQHRYSHLLLPPLYHIAESSKLWKQLAEPLANAVVLCWLHPRPASWLLQRHGIVAEEQSILNLNGFSDVESAWQTITHMAQDGHRGRAGDRHGDKDAASAPPAIKLSARGVKPRWYPVIDGSRCVQCQHCLQFCLFGVYELDAEGKVQVRNPDQCKPGCPACSRVCPHSAIMFPLYEKDDAIAGAPGQFVVRDAAARRMFYTRTQQPCTACGRKAERKSATPRPGDRLCPECGRALSSSPPAKDSASAADRPAFDDLDILVDQLDRAMQRRR